jgi:hypothetical protein
MLPAAKMAHRPGFRQPATAATGWQGLCHVIVKIGLLMAIPDIALWLVQLLS